jgi:hypothetical protein
VALLMGGLAGLGLALITYSAFDIIIALESLIFTFSRLMSKSCSE